MSTGWAFDTLHHRLRVRGQLEIRTGLRIGTGRDTSIVGHDLPVIRDAAGRPFIPGSSFKGVLRANLEALLRGLSDDPEIQRQKLACMVLVREGRCIPDSTLQELRVQFQGKAPSALSQQIVEQSCLICQTFGSPWLASHVAIRDMPVVVESWFDQFGIRQGVALDRDTGTAGNALLYSFETVPPGTRFEVEIEGDNLQPWQRGLLWLGLQPFVRGEASLGGARSRGLGQVQLLENELTWQGWERQGPESVLTLLENGPTELPTSEMADWRVALQDKLKGVTHA